MVLCLLFALHIMRNTSGTQGYIYGHGLVFGWKVVTIEYKLRASVRTLFAVVIAVGFALPHPCYAQCMLAGSTELIICIYSVCLRRTTVCLIF